MGTHPFREQPPEWESERAGLKKSSRLGTVFQAIVVSLFGGVAGSFITVVFISHCWPMSLWRGGAFYLTATIGFIWGIFFSLRVILGAVRHQREFERRYGGRDE